MRGRGRPAADGLPSIRRSTVRSRVPILTVDHLTAADRQPVCFPSRMGARAGLNGHQTNGGRGRCRDRPESAWEIGNRRLRRAYRTGGGFGTTSTSGRGRRVRRPAFEDRPSPLLFSRPRPRCDGLSPDAHATETPSKGRGHRGRGLRVAGRLGEISGARSRLGSGTGADTTEPDES